MVDKLRSPVTRCCDVEDAREGLIHHPYLTQLPRIPQVVPDAKIWSGKVQCADGRKGRI
jgi:hypothetical protein